MTIPYVVNEIQLSYKYQTDPTELPQVTGAEDAYKILLGVWDHNRLELAEDCKVMLLNRANRVLGIYHVSSGGTAGTVADTKLILVAALKSNAHNIIMAHNHPSGNLQPSSMDILFTQAMRTACGAIGVKMLDHLILTDRGYYSFSDEMTHLKIEYAGNSYFECQPPF